MSTRRDITEGVYPGPDVVLDRIFPTNRKICDCGIFKQLNCLFRVAKRNVLSELFFGLVFEGHGEMQNDAKGGRAGE